MAKSKKKTALLKWAIAFAAVGILVGLVFAGTANEAREEEEKKQEIENLELNVPSLVGREGFLAVDSSGSAIPLSEANGEANRVEFVFDLHCGGCHLVETGIHDTLVELMESGEAQFYFSPVSFMNGASTDDYSARAASTLMVVAQEQPELFFDYLGALYENFPEEGAGYPRAGVSYDDLGAIAREVGVEEDLIDKFSDQEYRLWATENAGVVDQRAEIFPQGISTPTVLIGGALNDEGVLEDFTKVEFRDPDVDKTFRETYEAVTGDSIS